MRQSAAASIGDEAGTRLMSPLAVRNAMLKIPFHC